DGDPDAEVEVEAVPVDFNALVEGTPQPARKQFGAGGQRLLFGDHDEFVAADARQKGALRGDLEAARGFTQRLVAHRMAEQIVDLLEMIEVDAEHAEAAAAQAGTIEDARKLVVQRGAVR